MDKSDTGKERKEEMDRLTAAGITGAAAETVQRYGSAVKEHAAAYAGQDNESGKQLKKGLKSIAESKVHPDYKKQNLKQQAGFAAEVKETAKANAEKIIQGSPEKKVRSDDLGRVNDPLYDHFEVDATGRIIPGSGSQMKFVGNTPQEALSQLASKKFSKYLESDVKIEVPSDFYDEILKQTHNKISDLKTQIARQRESGSPEAVKTLEAELEKYEKIRKNLRPSTVSSQEAMFARLHPKLSTAKDIAKLSHRAGMESAKFGAVVGGSVSIVQNLVALVNGTEEPEKAAAEVARNTGSAAAMGYGTGFAGASVKGLMQNARSESVRALARTNLPGVIAAVGVGSAKTMRRYFSGEINGLECFEELGEQGTGMLSSALFATIGQAVIPIPVAGGLVGGMLGYAVASASYGILLSSLKEEKFVHEERLLVEAECARQIELIRTYRNEVESLIEEHLACSAEAFHRGFDNLKESLRIGNVDGFITAANSITEAVGKEALFRSQDEFNALMEDDRPIKF